MNTVSYGHAHEIAARAAGAPPAVDTPPIDPALYWRDNVRPVLAARDIGVLYLVLKDDAELTQRRIAELTGQSQSEVSEILKGRQVRDVTVLERIAKGLGIPLELMGLSYGEHSAYGEDSTVAEAPDGVDENMQRRDLIAMSAFATLGFVPFGTLLNPPPGPGVLSLPSQLGMTDVVEIKNTIEQLRSAARARGGQARAVSAAAIEYGRLTQVPAAEPVAARLGSVLADLHTLAGWCCYDSGLSRRARWHYRQAIDYATAAPDDYRLADVLQYVGILERAAGHPNEAVKFYQLAGFHLGAKGDPGLVAWGHGLSALALANLEHPQAAEHLTRAREGWQPSSAPIWTTRLRWYMRSWAIWRLRSGSWSRSMARVGSGRLGPSLRFSAPRSTCGPGSPAGWRSRTVPSPPRQSSAPCVPGSGSNRLPLPWRAAPVPMPISWRGWPARSPPRRCSHRCLALRHCRPRSLPQWIAGPRRVFCADLQLTQRSGMIRACVAGCPP